jgi:hypothetical protein
MKLIVKWDEPTPVTGRTYAKGCMKFKSAISDIFLANDIDEMLVGKCRMVSDEVGLWATDIEYFVDENALKELLATYISSDKGTTDLALSCYATDNKKITDATFSCLRHHVFTSINLKEIFRDLKLSALI